LRLPDDDTKYSHKWKWVEFGKYDPKKDRVFRISKKIGKEWVPETFHHTEAEAFADKNDRLGIYTSVFHYDSRDYVNSSRLGSIYFDLDSADTDLVLRDAKKLVDFFLDFLEPEQLRIYFTGKKGFHIEVEALAVGVIPDTSIADVFRLIASDMKDKLQLETIDFQVYDLRRMWRLPNTKHQSTGLYKVPLEREDLNIGVDHIKAIAEQPIYMEVPEQKFSYEANKWYKEYVYKFEKLKIDQNNPQDLFEMFKQYGTSGLRVSSGEKIFSPIDLFENCPSIMRLWEKAEKDRFLEHEERLFLCSLLSYSDEAIEYLHLILQNCSDYQYEKTQSHIEDWTSRRRIGIGGRPFSCRRANAGGYGCGSCDLEPKNKWIKVGDSWVESDVTADPSPIRFAYRNKGQ
jgi:hypothetical protein